MPWAFGLVTVTNCVVGVMAAMPGKYQVSAGVEAPAPMLAEEPK